MLAAAPQLDQQGFLLAVDSWPGPAGWAGRLALSRAEAVLSYLLVLVLTVLCALWGAFLVPLRLFGVSAPVSVLFAMANAPLVFAGRRVARSHWGGTVPALLWLGLALRLGTPSSGGDIVIEATPTGYASLLVGTVAAAVGLCAPHRPVGQR